MDRLQVVEWGMFSRFMRSGVPRSKTWTDSKVGGRTVRWTMSSDAPMAMERMPYKFNESRRDRVPGRGVRAYGFITFSGGLAGLIRVPRRAG
jgi:hypothetical protein